MAERRRVGRIETNLRARWEGVLTQREGEVVDLSATGCFILTADEVKPNELIRLEIRLDETEAVYLWGEVVYKIPEIGFGVRFNGSDEQEEARLFQYIRDRLQTQPA